MILGPTPDDHEFQADRTRHGRSKLSMPRVAAVASGTVRHGDDRDRGARSAHTSQRSDRTSALLPARREMTIEDEDEVVPVGRRGEFGAPAEGDGRPSRSRIVTRTPGRGATSPGERRRTAAAAHAEAAGVGAETGDLPRRRRRDPRRAHRGHGRRRDHGQGADAAEPSPHPRDLRSFSAGGVLLRGRRGTRGRTAAAPSRRPTACVRRPGDRPGTGRCPRPAVPPVRGAGVRTTGHGPSRTAQAVPSPGRRQGHPDRRQVACGSASRPGPAAGRVRARRPAPDGRRRSCER